MRTGGRQGTFCQVANTSAEQFSAATARPAPPDDLTLQRMYVQPDRHQVYEQGLWAVWYDPAFFTQADAQITADGLDSASCSICRRPTVPISS